MIAPRRLLMVEDDPFFAELLRLDLSKVWPECEYILVDNQKDFAAALAKNDYDAILSDYTLPGFSGMKALELARRQCPEIPFLFVSGTIGDEVAVESLKAGATDYVLKDRIARLAPAIQRALNEVAERKAAEEKVACIQAKLEETNRDLLLKNQEIQNFYHTLSHELKSPLTSAREFISIVMDRLAGPLNDTQSEYLGIALESCDQLRVCINDLLDATRLETGKLALELKQSSLAVLVQRLVTMMHSKANESKIALSCEAQDDLPPATLDEHRMTQVISNLLNNAFKHTPSGGEVRVEVAEPADRPGFLQVTVSDTGHGIPKEEQNRIFDRLYQVKAGDATTEQGIGLGLYLCQELIQLHGGNIWVESEPGKGSTFRFVVPKNT